MCALAAHAAPIRFDLPAQPLPSALVAFSKQSGADVLYSFAELKNARSNAVEGEFEPDRAMDLLLANTGFKATRNEAGKFVVTKQSLTGAIRGTLMWPDGGPAQGVSVFVRESGHSTVTDRYGEYTFDGVTTGDVLLVARAGGFQPLHIANVRVQANRELIISRQAMRKANDLTQLEPFTVTAESVTALQKFEVTSDRTRQFTPENLDLPRTIDDVQPYYIFDATSIDTSGATNIEDFLKQRLTMNTLVQANGDIAGSNQLGNTSSIDLRGVGTDKTLILVNGRRVAGVTLGPTNNQPDLNGIPLSAIDRIEVLPSSASGIYGGSAIGGVVNVILKRNYRGGEIRATYDNTWDTDSPRRTVALSYGLALEGGRSHLGFHASWADASPRLLQDRVAIFRSNLESILGRSPSFIYSSTSPFLGSLPNITPSAANVVALQFKNGPSLNSRNTFIPAGTSPSTSSADLRAGLLANAGQWNLDLPASTQGPTGLLRPFGVVPKTRSFQATFRRQMWPCLELFAEFSLHRNDSVSIFNPVSNSFSVPATAPTNPFTTAVLVRLADHTPLPIETSSQNQTFTLGAMVKLPWDWTSLFDYSRTENRLRYQHYFLDFAAQTADLASGALNPFVDNFSHPIDFSAYSAPRTYHGVTTLQVGTVKASGPLVKLPWGQPRLALGLERRRAFSPERTLHTNFTRTSVNSNEIAYYAQKSVTDSGYAELHAPLVKGDWVPGLHQLELQLSGRAERFDVQTGTMYETRYFNRMPPETVLFGAQQNGMPYSSRTNYTSTNYTMGIQYKPLKELALRVSRATAFLPPSIQQLTDFPQLNTGTTNIMDPVRGVQTAVFTRSGGNPTLKPQTSRSVNAGLIWRPSWKPLQGLRLNVEYYLIQQFDAIGQLSAQTIVSQEQEFPGRVERDSTGRITVVDMSFLNLYLRETEGWDLTAAYSVETPRGQFNLQLNQTIIQHLKSQFNQGQPQTDAVHYPSESGAVKYRSNGSLSWSWKGWNASWATRYVSSYRQFGSPGGPGSMRFRNGGVYNATYSDANGSDRIPSQIYHDATVGYSFGAVDRTKEQDSWRGVRRLLAGTTVQLGVRNVFDKVPPLDSYYANNYYLSPYGDMRLRSYWISLKRTF